MEQLTITKFYGEDGPYECLFRDYKTDGFLRGHRLSMVLDFYYPTDDVLSAGQMEDYLLNKTSWIDEYLHECFSNTTLVSTEDPLANVIIILETEALIDVRLMRDVSLSGFEAMIMEDFSKVLKEQTNGQVGLLKVTVLDEVSS